MAEHKHPNYMAIFWYLAVLTAAEIFIVLPQFRPENKLIVGTLLCIFAIWKAALVAMYFMHLKLETRTLALIALTPLTINAARVRAAARWLRGRQEDIGRKEGRRAGGGAALSRRLVDGSLRWPKRCAGWRRVSAGGCACAARAAVG